jgi:hypothetical protein
LPGLIGYDLAIPYKELTTGDESGMGWIKAVIWTCANMPFIKLLIE